MKAIEIKTLSEVSHQDILECFNLSFSDYSIPFKLNLEQLEIKLKTENINKAISIGAFKEQKLIGFVLHGERNLDKNLTSYNAGTGVIPNERGQGLTNRMYEFIKPKFNSSGFKEVVLEVISNNSSAIKNYEKIGFEPVRDLNCYKGELLVDQINKGITIKQVENVNFENLNQFGEIEPTWQNSKETIINLGSDAICLLAYADSELCGYTVVNRVNNRILQIAVKEAMRNRLIGSTMLKYVKDKITKSTTIINVDSCYESTLNFLESRNLRKFLVQKEMKLKISRR